MSKLARRLWHEESGQDLTEYALLLALIALASIASMQALATAISNVYGNAASNLSAVT
jgi:Flp pilus assembly pilin Flp